MGLWVPPSVQTRLVDERRQDDAEVDRLVQHDIETAKRFDRELKRIDPYLELAYIGRPPSWADGVDPPPGIVWHRWHVIRHNPDAPDSYTPHVGAGGEYREPDSGLFEELAASDMWSSQNQARARRREAQAQAERARSKEREREAIKDEIAERLRSRENPSVSFADAGKWSYRAGARKG